MNVKVGCFAVKNVLFFAFLLVHGDLSPHIEPKRYAAYKNSRIIFISF